MLLSGKAMWASITSPGITKFPPPKYSLDLVLDDETADRLKTEGFNVRDNKEYSPFITIKREVNRKDGSANAVPKLVDADKNPLDCKVGNGSDVTVQCRPYDWTFGDRSGRNLDLQAVQVNNLIEYEGTSVDGEELGLDDNEETELEF